MTVLAVGLILEGEPDRKQEGVVTGVTTEAGLEKGGPSPGERPQRFQKTIWAQTITLASPIFFALWCMQEMHVKELLRRQLRVSRMVALMGSGG